MAMFACSRVVLKRLPFGVNHPKFTEKHTIHGWYKFSIWVVYDIALQYCWKMLKVHVKPQPLFFTLGVSIHFISTRYPSWRSRGLMAENFPPSSIVSCKHGGKFPKVEVGLTILRINKGLFPWDFWAKHGKTRVKWIRWFLIVFHPHNGAPPPIGKYPLQARTLSGTVLIYCYNTHLVLFPFT